ncbi:MAG: TonB-dependent receptor plug domain-containing protein [Phycisphaerae bacterium]
MTRKFSIDAESLFSFSRILWLSVLPFLATTWPAMAEPEAPAEIQEPRASQPEDAPPATASAGEGDWFDYPEVLVTATRSEIKSFAAPYTTDIVPISGFSRQTLPRTPTRALEAVPGVMVQKTSHAQGSPYIRGFTSFRTLLLVDGIRLNNSAFRPGPNQYWNLVDPYTIDRMEVVKGPASVLYGSDAIGGTVNAILRRPEGYGEGWNVYRQIEARVSTAERSYIARGEVNATYGPWLGIVAGGTWKDFGDVDGGGGVGVQDKTGYEVSSGDIRMEYHPDADSVLTFAHYHLYEDDGWRTHKTIYGISWEDTTFGNELRRVIDLRRSLTYLRYARRDMGSFVDAMELTASFQELAEEQWRTRADGRRDRSGFDLYTIGLAAQFETPSPIGHWTYGVEWYHDEVRSFRRNWAADGTFSGNDIQGPVADDASYDLLGIYVQNRIPIAERLELLLGGRWTYARADAGEVEDPLTGNEISLEDSWDSLVGSARLSWFIDEQEHWNLFGGISQGFRAPNLSDLTRLDDARSGERETPSPGLDPEFYLSYEIGLKTQYENVSAQVGLFYTDIQDMIVRYPTGNIVDTDKQEVTKSNVGDGHAYGIEFDARWRFHPQWTAFGSLTCMNGEVDTYPTSAQVVESEPLSRLMPIQGQAGLRWDHPDKKFWVEGVVNATGKADRLSTRDARDTDRIPPGGTPGYFTIDLHAGWRVQEGLEVFAGLENLTNEGYRIHGSGVNEPGINFVFGIKWRF